MASQVDRAKTLVERHGTTFAEQAGIKMADKPSPLYQLLVLSMLLSARISADIAVAAARELSKAGYRTPERMLEASWQDRVDALGRGRYRRYDERTATMLGNGAEALIERYKGDLRILHQASEDTPDVERRLQEFPGIGSAGAAIFCREAQGVWPDLAPYLDKRVLDGARKLDFPTDPGRLAKLVSTDDLPALTAGCVRAALSDDVVSDVKGA
ncbi:endonuclease [Phytoactinopolyspora mesophila]|uniref:Endonuclease n=1 Tax=Phytoactinopolyspora mesophila TaxID=2650750 RepID=A0A7K3M5F0_9ACTN|nr:endonuclease [Phytoactinopolyspora mesophila]NDL58440.1 endonuclease [Phytoactinopolyspora mesophila]